MSLICLKCVASLCFIANEFGVCFSFDLKYTVDIYNPYKIKTVLFLFGKEMVRINTLLYIIKIIEPQVVKVVSLETLHVMTTNYTQKA